MNKFLERVVKLQKESGVINKMAEKICEDQKFLEESTE